MADKKISALTAATTPLAGTEVLPIVQGGSTVKVSVANLTAGRATSALKQSVESFTPDGGSYVHVASTANAASRYWRTANDVSAWADWALQQSTDNTGAAYTTRFYFDGNGNGTVYGNISAGAAPNAWGAGFYAVQANTGAAMFGDAGNLYLNANSYWDGAAWRYTTSNYAARYEQTSGSHSWYVAGSGTAGTTPSFTQAMGISNAGNVTANVGNFVVGTAGKGIDFSANANAPGMTSELLTWYEEGVWTPAQGAGLTVVGSFSSSGTYTRIGRMVIIRAKIDGSTSVSAASASQLVTGLPFAPAADTPGTWFDATLSNGGVIDAAPAGIYSVGAIGATTTIYVSASYMV